MNQDIRWQQRFENFERALGLLREALKDVESLSELEKEGLVQRFEYTLELAWNTLRDYLYYQGIAVEPATPRTVIKQAFKVGIIDDGQLWLEMIDHRNLLSHTYNMDLFSKAVLLIAARYCIAFDALETFLQKELQS